jgi:hypothetical protein
VRHVRMLGLCLVAVLAVAAYAVSSASALPEFGRCKEQAGGKYSDAGCTVKAKKGAGNHEWVKGVAGVEDKTFTTKGGSALLVDEFVECSPSYTKKPDGCAAGEKESRASLPVECTEETGSGELAGSKELGKIVVTFHNCQAEGLPCENGVTAGEIKINQLKGKLGYVSKASKEVGVVLEPVAKKAEFAHFDCTGILTIHVGVGNPKTEGCAYEAIKGCGNDGITSPITPVNTMTKEYTQVFAANEAFENVPQLEKGKQYHLETWLDADAEPLSTTEWSRAGEELTNVATAKEASEIKA